MKRNLCLCLLFVSLLLGSTLPINAAPPNAPAKSWKITMRAHVLYNKGDSLMVYMKSPKSMETQEDVSAYPIIALPITENTKVADSKGNALKLSNLLQGQEVKVTFRYYVEKTETQWWSVSGDESGVSVSYSYKAVECQNIELVGDTIKLKNRTTLDELKQDTMLGTILTVNGNKLEVYVEGGRIISELSGTEFMARGIQDANITSDTKLLDAQGNIIAPSVIKPFQRVLLKGMEHNWYDGSLGYGGSIKYTRVQVLNDGEKMLSSGDVENFRRMTGIIVKQQKNEAGTVQLVIQPDEGSRERKLQAQYVITQMDSAVSLQSFPVGSRVEFEYEGLNYKTSPGRILEYYHIKLAADKPASTDDEIAITIGKSNAR